MRGRRAMTGRVPVFWRTSMLSRACDVYAGALDQPAHGQPQQRGDLPPPLFRRHRGLGMLDGHGAASGDVDGVGGPHHAVRSPFT